MLSSRQQLTIQNLKDHQHLATPKQIIEYCKSQIAKPFWRVDFMAAKEEGRPRLRGSQVCKRNHIYYQEIINHFLNNKE